MLSFRPLPWDYGVRNLLQRPGRSALTLLGLGTVSWLRDVAIDLVVRDRSPHIPSRVIADEHRQQLCHWG